ncbi:MAG: tetrathionate reductase family octaheme c-type cytochrome [Anaerolineales bacterium]|nr:tetrathionate reductase family octaheme c-type cytochrome [Anaerolineales bacterium]
MRRKQIVGIMLAITAVFLTAIFMWQSDVVAASADVPLSDPVLPLLQQDTETGDEGEAVEGEGIVTIPADHREFEELQQEFETGPDVTRACLSCHVDAAQEIMTTSHWTWEYENPDTGQILGKQNVINNFCVAIDSNEPRCTSCHTGYGWTDNTFDFTAEENVDCLVCHDTTGTYKKYPTAAGHPLYEPIEVNGVVIQPPDLAYVAQNIGDTSRQTCGACHFYGGGADGVKHGDMDSSLTNPDYELDVHMDVDGLNFTCTECHTSDGHVVSGSRYSMNSTDEETCESCHTAEPHQYDMLNQHIDRIACQTCHIPEYARGGVPTKMYWDWSTAGELDENGKPFKVVDPETGHVTYDSMKGNFEFGEDVVPEYIWFNGEVEYTLVEDVFDPSQPVVINPPQGSIADENARIWPMKVFDGVQPYDSGNNTLVIPHLFGSDPAAYWKSYDWETSIAAGMAYSELPYSGEYGFVETTMYWPITHMVAPAEEALQCNDCHTPEDGRLDFAALGYDEDAVQRLTHFPPTLLVEELDAPHFATQYCAECHENEHTAWVDSTHGEKGVACVNCHKLEDETNEHPTAAYSVDRSGEVCGACHLNEHADWEMSVHAEAEDPIACADCHNPHTQQLKTANGNTTICENCHEDQAHEMPDSTHAATGMTCLDCHKNTELNTGHAFNVASDTCILCHAKDAHTANGLLEAGVDVSPATLEERLSDEEASAAMETAVTDEVESKGIVGLPNWMVAFPILALVISGVWVVAGKDPGYRHQDKQK